MTDNTINNDMTMGGSNGALLAGRYRVVRQLGQGGMGSVWLAEDEKLDGFKVAIKMLPSVLVNNKRAYAQVKSEALVSLKLSHSNIATVRAFEEESGNPFLVMDYIDGQTLDDYLVEKGKLTEEETIKLLKPVAAALDYAHTQGVVHRDVKPGNIMIRRDGTPFVLDFGIAREIQETMTRVTGKLSSGTLLYMSPEQLHGAAPSAAQDIYSFAAMTYECLTGNPPFARGQIEYQIEHDIPTALDPQFAKCGAGVMAGLAKLPEDRLTTCAAVLSAGPRVLRDRADDGPLARRTRIAVVLLGVLAFVALIGGGGWFWRQKSMSDELAAERARQVEIATREVARQKAEAARIATEKVEAERKAKVEAERIAEEKRKVETARIAVATAAQEVKADAERIVEGKRKAEEMQIAAKKEVKAALKIKAEAERIAAGHKVKEVAEQKALQESEHLRELKVGDVKTIILPGGVPMDFVWCPPGSFMMGSPTEEKFHADDETQCHMVVARGFWMGKCEVTQRQWESVMGENPSRFKGADRPVEMVSWDDCKRFIQTINAKGLALFALPSEVQWEYACRAGTTTPFSFGSTLNGDRANCNGNFPYGTSVKGRYRDETAPVGSYAPNAWGIYDMHGNVYEWCEDCSVDDGDVKKQTRPTKGVARIRRGGSWFCFALYCRSALRGRCEPDYRGDDQGFRLVYNEGLCK